MTLHPLPDVRHPRRLIALDGVHNFRDLGGYPTADGRTTRWGRLYRADGLFRLTTADVEALRPLGLRTVVDLRTHEELELRGRFPVEAHPVAFHHIPVLDTTWAHPDERIDDVAEFLCGKYQEMLTDAPHRFAEALDLMGAADALPAVFHCAAGKDRTGVTAMLVLGSLGVPREYIAADYQLTAEAMDRMLAWAQRQRVNSSETTFSAKGLTTSFHLKFADRRNTRATIRSVSDRSIPHRVLRHVALDSRYRARPTHHRFDTSGAGCRDGVSAPAWPDTDGCGAGAPSGAADGAESAPAGAFHAPGGGL